MKLKTRIKLAWSELVSVSLILLAVVTVDVTRPRPSVSFGGIAMSVALTLAVFAPLCVQSWRRLRQTRAQLAKLGPDAAPSADLWTAPGTPGMLGLMVLIAAVAAALVPALLYS